MQTSSDSLNAAITAPERVVGHIVEIDWDDDGYDGVSTPDDLSQRIQSIKTSQTLTTNVPEQVRVISGASVAQCDAVIGNGNMFNAPVTVSLRSYSTSVSATGVSATGVGITKPTGAQDGDVLILSLTIYGDLMGAGARDTEGLSVLQPNVSWGFVARRDLYDAAAVYSTLLLKRRVDADDPSSYTFVFKGIVEYAAVMLCVGDAGNAGVHAFTESTTDLYVTDAYTDVHGRPIDVTLAGSSIFNIYQSFTAAATPTWTFDADETSVVNTKIPSTSYRIPIGVSQRANVDAGSYTASAMLTQGGTPLDLHTNIVWSIAIAPQLAGSDRQNTLWTYSELNPLGPLAGKQRDARPMRWSTVFATSAGIESVPMFNGFTLGTSTDRGSGTITFTALDNRELFRKRPNLPTTVNEWLRPLPGETLPYAHGLETTWLVSYILGKYDTENRIGFYAAPPARVGSTLYVPCHGSLSPFIGSTKYAYTERASQVRRVVHFDWGPYVGGTEKAPTNGEIAAGWDGFSETAFYVVGASGYSTGRVEFYAKLDTDIASTVDLYANAFSANTYSQVQLTGAGIMRINLVVNGSPTTVVDGPALPSDGEWHAYGFHWDSQAGSATFVIDDSETVVAFAALVGNVTSSATSSYEMSITNLAQIAEIHFTGGDGAGESTQYVTASSPWVWENFTRTAYIDRSQNELVAAVYDYAQDDDWSILTSLAEAENAAVYFDQQGYPHFRTGAANVTAEGRAVVRSVTTTNALTDVDYVANITQIANDVTVQYSSPELHLNGVLYSPPSLVYIPAHSTLDVPFNAPGLIFTDETITVEITEGNTAVDGSGAVISAMMIITGYDISGAGFGTINIENNAGQGVWLVDTSGNNTFTVYGSFVKNGSANASVNYTDDASIRAHNTQPLTISSSRWRQTESMAQTLAVRLLYELAEIRPVLKNVKIVGDPRLQIGDVIRIEDLTSLGIDDTYRIAGLAPSVSSGNAFTTGIIARQAREINYWDQSKWNDGGVWSV